MSEPTHLAKAEKREKIQTDETVKRDTVACSCFVTCEFIDT